MIKYTASRLLFRKSVIEELSMDESFQIVTPEGTFQYTRREFEGKFPNVVQSNSYQIGGVYHYPRTPQRAQENLIGRNPDAKPPPEFNESSFILEWTDAEAKGVMDWLPLSWFAEEGSFLRKHHPVGTKNRRQGKAFCDVTVTSLTAKLDYLLYPSQNGPNEIIPGVVRFTFSDEDRTEITGVDWSTDGISFSPAEYLLRPVVLPARTPYTPPTKTAGKTEKLVRERPGQVKFRRELRLVYGHCCCLTRCSVTETLEGAHIDPYQSPVSDHIQNGLLLRSDIHKLFDSHLIGIDPTNHTVYLVKRLRKTTDYQSLHGAKINLPADPSHHPDCAALERHWKKIAKS